MTSPRGIRNHNPGNIIRTTIQWDGASDDPRLDDKFVCFDAPVMGLRCLAKILLTYTTKHKLKTVRAIIDRFAPSSENDTDSYVRHVCKILSVKPLQKLQINDSNIQLVHLMQAIVNHENGPPAEGEEWYPEDLYFDAVEMARG